MILTQRVNGWWVTDCRACGAGHVLAVPVRLPLTHHRQCVWMVPKKVTNLRWVGPSYVVRGKFRYVFCAWHGGEWRWQPKPRRTHSSQYGFQWKGWGIELGKLRLEISRSQGSRDS